MSVMTRPRSWILLEPLAAAVLWGGVFTAAKVGMQEIPVATFTLIRALLAAGLLLALAGGLRTPRQRGPLWRPLVLAALGQTTFQILFLQGLHATTASVSAILLASAPLLTAAWLGATGRKRLARRQW